MKNRAEQLIDLYFFQKLSPEEEHELKSLLETDTALAQDFSLQLQLSQQAAAAGRFHPLKQRLQQLEQQLPPENPHPPNSLPVAGIAATALVLILLLGFAYWYFSTPPVPPPTPPPAPANQVVPPPQPPAPAQEQASPTPTPAPQVPKAPVPALDVDTVMQRYFRHFPNKVTVAVAGLEDSIPGAIQAAFRDYDNRNYRAAASKLGSIVQFYPTQSVYQFYYGVALIGDKQYKKAIEPLRSVSRQEGEYRAPALYYLALAYAGTQQYGLSRKTLNAYLNDEYGITYRKNAEQLLAELPR